MPSKIDLIEQRFGKLIVIRKVNNDKWGNSRWLCQCDCGQEKIICGSSLKNNRTKSCGCFLSATTKKRFTKHNHYKGNQKTPTYKSWDGIIQRCTNPNNKAYHNYGGRGIIVYERWLKFENFLEDMGEIPQDYQIDRIDNNQGYYKENCHWVTPQEQARNRRNNHLETYKRKTQCLIMWAEECNISYKTLWHRIYKLGWLIEKALITPVREWRKRNA